jgi:hypothetical protein
MMTRRDLLGQGALAAAGFALHREGSTTPMSQPGTTSPRKSFKPGEVWLDTSGKPIQAHGGSILSVDGTFYWYGENKEGFVPGSGKWHNGIRCYSSTDLYNWADCGAIIPATPDDPKSPMHPSRRPERPHIFFNKKTQKFVCWVKVIAEDGQTRSVFTADSITGPYSLVHSDMHPLGMNAGDFDLAMNPRDGKGYMYFERLHSEMICADLSEDYTQFDGYYSTHFPHPYPPAVREGPAYFYRKGKHYLATSGLTGYHPNPSEIASADTFHGPWTVLGDLHPSDNSRTSFNSQISSIFKVPGKKDLFLALADRWIPDLAQLESQRYSSGAAYREIESALTKVSNQDKLTEGEQRALQSLAVSTLDTSRSTYVWLPIRFDRDHPVIEWQAEWSLASYE